MTTPVSRRAMERDLRKAAISIQRSEIPVTRLPIRRTNPTTQAYFPSLRTHASLQPVNCMLLHSSFRRCNQCPADIPTQLSRVSTNMHHLGRQKYITDNTESCHLLGYRAVQSVYEPKNTWCYIPEDGNFPRYKNLKSFRTLLGVGKKKKNAVFLYKGFVELSRQSSASPEILRLLETCIKTRASKN